MKQLIVFLTGLLFALSLSAQVNINFPFGDADSETVTVTNDSASYDLIDLVNIVTLTTDTNDTYFYLSSVSTDAGALLYLKVTATDTSNVSLGSTFAHDKLHVLEDSTVLGTYLYDGAEILRISREYQ